VAGLQTFDLKGFGDFFAPQESKKNDKPGNKL